jgi:hypothetical protein
VQLLSPRRLLAAAPNNYIYFSSTELGPLDIFKMQCCQRVEISAAELKRGRLKFCAAGKTCGPIFLADLTNKGHKGGHFMFFT